jgi:uncharacterized OB-fold protein
VSDDVFTPRYTPSPTGYAAEFYAHCAQGELRFQRCDAAGCRRWRHPPRVACPECGAEAWPWQPSTGRGTLHSWTVTHQALAPGFADDLPYAVVVVELEEGVRLVSALRGVALDALELGLPLEVAFAPASGEVALHYFRPRAG